VRRRAAAAGKEVVTAGRSPLPDSPRHYRVDLGSDHILRIAGVLAEVAPDAVVNCAGATLGSTDVMARANITGTDTLIHAMLLSKNAPRLVHLGSAAEYGRVRPRTPVSGQIPARPLGVYGATKLAGTRMVEPARSAGLDGVVLRVFNPVGSVRRRTAIPGA
jgi:nucleoside-diphosphate-sugar epimerase